MSQEQKAQILITADPGCFEELLLMEEREETARLFDGDHLWNDGSNYPPGFNELTDL